MNKKLIDYFWIIRYLKDNLRKEVGYYDYSIHCNETANPVYSIPLRVSLTIRFFHYAREPWTAICKTHPWFFIMHKNWRNLN